MRISRLIPSMYQRRLALLVALLVTAGVPPVLQAVRLTVAKGEDYRAEAERRLVDQTWLATVRGSILDRKGRVLAMDRASFDVTVEYSVITNQWAFTQARRKARNLDRTRWLQMSPGERDELTARYVPEFLEQIDGMWERLARIAGVGRDELDRRIGEIKDHVGSLAVTLVERQRAALAEQLSRGADSVEVTTADVQRPIAEQVGSHVVLSNVSWEVGTEISRMMREAAPAPGRPPEPAADPFPGVRVVDSVRREYPLDTVTVDVDLGLLPGPLRGSGSRAVRVEGVATHVLGWMRDTLYKEDTQRRPLRRDDGSIDLGHYRPGDAVGQAGLEAAAEDELRGLRGLRKHHLDTGAIEETPAEHGRDLRLTLDAALQARVQALFDRSLGLTVVQPWHKSRAAKPPEPGDPREIPPGTPLNGAVVVIEVDSGDVLAMVSAPSFSHERLKTEAASIFKDELNLPNVNRAIERPYPPGSIVKPLILAGAATAGRYSIGERIDCTGHFFPDKPLLYRCWIYKQFHSTHTDQFGHALDGGEAIQASCNVFFYELGRRLGPRGIVDWYTRFGVGPEAERWNLFAPPKRGSEPPRVAGGVEYAGSLPDPAKAGVNDAVLLGIGQGPIAWTPLHAADAYATLARGGVKITPRLRTDAAQRRTDLKLDRRAVGEALRGLRLSASEPRGTTHTVSYDTPDGRHVTEKIFDAPGVDVWAKSGTADTAPFSASLTYDGAREEYDGDHAWCVFLCGADERPLYAVAVVVDRGGSGGRVAGPVANQVVHALIAEGYLPKVDQRADADAGSSAGAWGRP